MKVRIRDILFLLWLDIKTAIRNTRFRIWNKHLLLWWYKLWVRKDEFHKSLNMDTGAMIVMNDKERNRYIDNLMKRRHIAHVRDMERSK
jgi:hypothetical protein